jgi:hypothetical protein
MDPAPTFAVKVYWDWRENSLPAPRPVVLAQPDLGAALTWCFSPFDFLRA